MDEIGTIDARRLGRRCRQAALQATLSNRNDLLGRRQCGRSVVRVVMAYIVLAAMVMADRFSMVVKQVHTGI